MIEEKPVIPESDIVINYINGEVSFSGTTQIKAGTVLTEAVYDSTGRLIGTKLHQVSDISDKISIAAAEAEHNKLMLWSGMSNPKPIAGVVTVE